MENKILQQILTKLDTMEIDIKGIKQGQDTMEIDIKGIKQGQDTMETDIKGIKQGQDTMETKIKDLEAGLELNTNIIIRMENEHGGMLKALYDGLLTNRETGEDLRSRVFELEKITDKHSVEIAALKLAE